MYYFVDFSRNIKILRKAKGLSQEQLAEKADISELWLREIEHGCANVTRDTMDRIAKALDVPVWMLHVLQFDPAIVGREMHEVQVLLGFDREAMLA